MIGPPFAFSRSSSLPSRSPSSGSDEDTGRRTNRLGHHVDAREAPVHWPAAGDGRAQRGRGLLCKVWPAARLPRHERLRLHRIREPAVRPLLLPPCPISEARGRTAGTLKTPATTSTGASSSARGSSSSSPKPPVPETPTAPLGATGAGTAVEAEAASADRDAGPGSGSPSEASRPTPAGRYGRSLHPPPFLSRRRRRKAWAGRSRAGRVGIGEASVLPSRACRPFGEARRPLLEPWSSSREWRPRDGVVGTVAFRGLRPWDWPLLPSPPDLHL